jgi:hypothetical protein
MPYYRGALLNLKYKLFLLDQVVHFTADSFNKHNAGCTGAAAKAL